MKTQKLITLIVSGLALLMYLSACHEKSALPEDAVLSPDGKYAVRADVQENLEDENGLLYSIYDVQLYDCADSALRCTYHIVGRDFRFLWSPDSQFIAAVYSGRTWTAFSVLDVRRHFEISLPGLSDILDSFVHSGATIAYDINPDRPDPAVSPMEWSPDSTRLLVSYQVRDSENKTQSGVFIYHFKDGTFSDLHQASPSEEDHPAVTKPEGFKWS